MPLIPVLTEIIIILVYFSFELESKWTGGRWQHESEQEEMCSPRFMVMFNQQERVLDELFH